MSVIKETPLEACLEVDTTKADIQQVLAKVTTHYKLDDIEIADPPIEEIIAEIYKRKDG